jgi:hypothetical protein
MCSAEHSDCHRLLSAVVVEMAVVVAVNYYIVTRPVFGNLVSRRVRLPDRTVIFSVRFPGQCFSSLEVLDSALTSLQMSLKGPRFCPVRVGNHKQGASPELPVL